MTFPKFLTSRTIRYAAAGAAILYAAFPPLDLWPLAWVAPVPWIMLIRQKELAGPRPYLALWLVGFFFWLATLHWLRLPDPATRYGWIALAFYYGIYIPAFVGLSRIAAHRLGRTNAGTLPAMLVAPIVWTGLELLRAHLFTGFSIADLAHTQYRWTTLIQMSDLAGDFGVGFVMVFVAACIARILPWENSPRVFWPLVPAVTMLTAILSYGYWRTTNVVTRPGPRIALIQGSIDTKFGGDEREVRDEFYNQYFELSKKAVREAAEQNKKIDLIVWPEIFFKERLISYDPDAGDNDPTVKRANLSGNAARAELRKWAQKTEQAFVDTTRRLNAPMLIGLDTWHFTASGVKNLNSAAYLSKSGKLLGRYDKIRLVPFGEYIPCADLLPWLYDGLTPLSGGMTPGKEPIAMDLDCTISPTEKTTIRFAPNICYETIFSRDLRNQINTLKAQGREPDVLINLSNDGWYWSSSELDQLFACSVFRAVECRKPYVIAANTGFSGSIDASGAVLLKGPRHDSATLLAEVQLDSRRSLYLQYGDWPAGVCLACCVFFAGVGLWDRFRRRRAA
jgi:apolipoprotein N-acyltransferase